MSNEQTVKNYQNSEFAKHFEFQNEDELREAERQCRGFYVGFQNEELRGIHAAPNQIDRLFYTIRALWAARPISQK